MDSEVLTTSFDCNNRVSQVRLIKEWGSARHARARAGGDPLIYAPAKVKTFEMAETWIPEDGDEGLFGGGKKETASVRVLLG